MTGRATEVIILCEDKQHNQFVRAFLRARGVSDRRIRSIHIPNGQGDAKKWIRDKFPNELQAYRAKANHLANLLIVITDIDNETAEQRAETLNKACNDSGVETRQDHERVAFILPKWAIETWILALDGRAFDESKKIEAKDKKEAESLNTAMAKKLSELCKQQQLMPPIPPSLVAACHEFRRIAAFL